MLREVSSDTSFLLKSRFLYTFMCLHLSAEQMMMTQFVIDNGGIMGQFIKAVRLMM